MEGRYDSTLDFIERNYLKDTAKEVFGSMDAAINSGNDTESIQELIDYLRLPYISSIANTLSHNPIVVSREGSKSEPLCITFMEEDEGNEVEPIIGSIIFYKGEEHLLIGKTLEVLSQHFAEKIEKLEMDNDSEIHHVIGGYSIIMYAHSESGSQFKVSVHQNWIY